MRQYLYVILICGVAASIFLNSILNKEYPDSVQIMPTEATFFDPICKDKQIFTIDYHEICIYHTQWSESLGISGNIDDVHDAYQTHLKTYFLKIDLSKVPKSDLFNKINVIDAKLILNVGRYDQTISPEIAVFNGFCQETDWNMTTPIVNLPCIGDGKQTLMSMMDFSEYEKINDHMIQDVEIKEHVNYALEKNLPIFTELIQFYPIQFKTSTYYTPEQRTCLYNNVAYVLDIEKCVKEGRVGLYSVEHTVEGLRPSLTISYKTIPTDLGNLLKSIVIFIPAITTIAFTIVKDRVSSKKEKKFEQKIDIQSQDIRETKEILQRKMKEDDNTYKIRIAATKLYLDSVSRALNEILLHTTKPEITTNVKNYLDLISEEIDDFEFGLKDLSRGVISDKLINDGLRICEISKHLTYMNNDIRLLNLEKCSILKNEITNYLQQLPCVEI